MGLEKRRQADYYTSRNRKPANERFLIIENNITNKKCQDKINERSPKNARATQSPLDPSEGSNSIQVLPLST